LNRPCPVAVPKTLNSPSAFRVHHHFRGDQHVCCLIEKFVTPQA
jgi:hypothetical protein